MIEHNNISKWLNMQIILTINHVDGMVWWKIESMNKIRYGQQYLSAIENIINISVYKNAKLNILTHTISSHSHQYSLLLFQALAILLL